MEEQYEKRGVRTGLVVALVIIVAVASVIGTLAVDDIIGAIGGGKYTVTEEEYHYLERYARLFETEKLLKENHLYTIDDETYVEYATKGLALAMGDPYTQYMTPEEYRAMNEEYSDKMAGAGMLIGIDQEDGMGTVLRVYPDTPAEIYGVERYDKIIEINGTSAVGMSVSEMASLIRGEAGTEVTLKLLRGKNNVTLTLTRAIFSVDHVTYEMLDGNIGYIELAEFTGNSVSAFNNALDALLEQGATSLVIDLRDDPGGYLDYVVQICDRLLPKGLVVYIENREGQRQEYNSDASCVDIPMAVLVNGNSASASEIMAGALQDHGAAVIIGTTTYGKGLVQLTQPFASDGAALKYTFAQYYTPNGRNINGIGIEPDIYVELEAGSDVNLNFVDREDDNQLALAIDYLTNNAANSSGADQTN